MIKDYILQQTNIELTDAMQDKFATYFDFLIEENGKYNLTAITERENVYVKHFADSILGSVAIPLNANLVDIGSGAGFPSLPLKIVRHDIYVTLVDSLEKRINFTKSLCGKLDISAEFHHARAEDFSKTYSERFDVATARAVAPLQTLLEYVAQAVKINGIVLAYKTDESELSAATNACKTLGLRHEHSYKFVLPDGSNRCLLTFRKTSHTPAKYPRGQNKPRKQPL
ncbi:MAG: 16S rRNA (guanine(527)-N(7))-methyltransferase RsmG [Corallococcus sp.]|nr:16S rRNA (guanine(527)-N(7))-methyltransferase RsmG [Bacillota bacterium]MCM1533190.1 16S rRNA (guanine(527)-N(7))-methyltransferase RsmG [Corallococcus sp.]